MIQRDFILRLIEQLGAMLRALMNGETLSAAATEETLREACEQGIGLTMLQLQHLEPAELVELLATGGGNSLGRVALAGCVFASRARLARQGGDRAAATKDAQKALFLFERVRANDAMRADYQIDVWEAELVQFLREESSAIP